MVRVIQQQPTLAEILGQTLGEQAGRATQGFANASQEYARQQAAQSEADKMADYYESIGLDRSLAYQPQAAQKDALKEFRRKKGWAETFGNYFSGKSPGQAGVLQGYRQGAPGETLGGNVLSKEQADALRELGYDVQLPNAPTSIAQRLASLGVGAGTGFAGRWGDILSGLGGLIESGAQKIGFPSREESALNRQEIIDQSPALQRLQQAGMFEEKEPNVLPTSTGIKNVIKQATKDTALENFLVPQTSTQKWYEDFGHIMSILGNPSKAYAQAGVKGLATDIAKTAGVTGAGDLAGWMVSNATGSQLAGDLVKNGMWLAYGLWPGTMKQVATKEYDLYKQNVIDKAAERGIKVDMTRYAKDIRDIENRIHKLVPGDPAYNWLVNEWNSNYNYLTQRAGQDPEALWKFIKGQKDKLMNAPDQAKDIFRDMIGVGERALEDMGKKIDPRAVQSLADANRLWRTQSQLGDQAKKIASSIKGSLGLGLYMFLGGGYKALLAAGATGLGSKYMSQMLMDPTMRSYITQLAKASARGNAQLINTLKDKMDKRARQVNPEAARVVQELMESKGLA